MPSRSRTDLAGRRAEQIACRYLRSHGIRILARNWRCRFGEIDLVARDGSTLVFVEVKFRSSGRFGGPEAALTPAKRRRMAATASLYLAEHESELPARFDVIAIRGASLRHYADAFRVEGPCLPGS